jgi:imidazolonepropionase-like amidohydrolase
VVIAIKGNEGSIHRAREARYNAGNAVAHGLPYLAAIEALTVSPARIFGLEGQMGGIRTGIEADVVVWTGDPLEPLSQPVAIFIAGRRQPLESRALELRDRYIGRSAMPPAYRN